jgi:hypothetical protein
MKQRESEREKNISAERQEEKKLTDCQDQNDDRRCRDHIKIHNSLIKKINLYLINIQ